MLDGWLHSTHGVSYTANRLALLSSAGGKTSLGDTANAAAIALLYANHMGPGSQRDMLVAWGSSQISAIVGEGSGRSYVVGYGKNYSQYVRHMGSTCRQVSVSVALCGNAAKLQYECAGDGAHGWV